MTIEQIIVSMFEKEGHIRKWEIPSGHQSPMARRWDDCDVVWFCAADILDELGVYGKRARYNAIELIPVDDQESRYSRGPRSERYISPRAVHLLIESIQTAEAVTYRKKMANDMLRRIDEIEGALTEIQMRQRKYEKEKEC